MEELVYNGVSLELNLMDAKVMENYEDKLQKVVEATDELRNTEFSKASEAIKVQCKLIDDFLNDLYFDGITEKLFGENKTDLRSRFEVYGMVCNLGDSIEQETDRLVEKYSRKRVDNYHNYNKKHKKRK